MAVGCLTEACYPRPQATFRPTVCAMGAMQGMLKARLSRRSNPILQSQTGRCFLRTFQFHRDSGSAPVEKMSVSEEIEETCSSRSRWVPAISRIRGTLMSGKLSLPLWAGCIWGRYGFQDFDSSVRELLDDLVPALECRRNSLRPVGLDRLTPGTRQFASKREADDAIFQRSGFRSGSRIRPLWYSAGSFRFKRQVSHSSILAFAHVEYT